MWTAVRVDENRHWLNLRQRFLKIRGEPREIGLGFALGIFIGMTPFMGFHTASAVFLAALFKWNKIAAAAAVWISNPATAPFVYGFTYYVGAKATGLDKTNGAPDFFSFEGLVNLFQNAPEILWALTSSSVRYQIITRSSHSGSYCCCQCS